MISRHMRRVAIAAIVFLALFPPASAQQYQTLPPNSIVANLYGVSNPGWAVSFNDFLKVLNLYSVTKVGDREYQILPTDRVVTTSSSDPLKASHTWTLPWSGDFHPGQPLYVADLGSQTSGSHTITIQSTGGDFINGGVAPITINQPNRTYLFITDGAGHWIAQAAVASFPDLSGNIAVSQMNGGTSASCVAWRWDVGGAGNHALYCGKRFACGSEPSTGTAHKSWRHL